MIVSMLAAGLLLAQAAPATQATATQATTTQVADKDPTICKNEAAPGSRMAKKVCAPKSEWERRKQEDRDNLERSQRSRTLNGS